MAKKRSQAAPGGLPAFVPPPSLSWVDRLTAWVERLPVPVWAFYAAAALGLVVIGWAWQASQGAYEVRPTHVFIAVQPVVALALIHYLDRVAGRAFDRLLPALQVDRIHPAMARWHLTHLPPRSTGLAALIGLLLVPPFAALTPEPAQTFQMAPTPVSEAEIVFFMGTIWITYAPLIYHTIHQLRWVRKILGRFTRVDPYAIDPLYAFSGLTARTALALMAINYGWTLVYPTPFDNPLNLGLTFFFAILAAVVFAWPLWGVHRLLVDEKTRLLADCSRRMKLAVDRLRRHIDSGKARSMDELHTVMVSLEIERSVLMRVPTWPWPPGTLRGVTAAVFLPLAIWLIQQVLQPLLAR